jgi:hypothetical protein
MHKPRDGSRPTPRRAAVFQQQLKKNQGVTVMFSNTAALSLSSAPLWAERPK